MNSVRQAFDRHAAAYDQIFLSTEIRSEVWGVADRLFFPGSRLLDLGCGTGDDAIHFVKRGLDVTAIDLSSEMISRLRAKAGDSLRCEVADMQTYMPRRGFHFDGLFSNFGALNCCPSLSWLGKLARSSLSSGSHVVLTTMGRFYPLESLVFLFRLQPRLALRRFGHPAEALVEGVRFHVYYHRVRDIREALGPEFELKQIVGLPSLFRLPEILKPVDLWLASNRITSKLADHFVSVWQYK